MMHGDAIWYALPLLWGAGAELLLAALAWRKRASVSGAGAFAVLQIGVAVWGAGYAAELLSASVPSGLLAAKVQWLAIPVVPVAWFVFACQYSGRGAMLTARRIAMIAIPCLLSALFAWTNELHGLMYAEIGTRVTSPFTLPVELHGIWWRLHIAYSYILLIAGTIVLAQALLGAPRLYGRQALIILLGLATPWIANIAYIAGAHGDINLDFTPYAFIVTGGLLFWGLFRCGLLETVPFAHEAIVSGMRDGVIVLDARGRIVEINPAGERITGLSGTTCVGVLAAEAFGDWPRLVDLINQPPGALDQSATVEITGQSYDVTISSPTSRPGSLAPRTCVLRDITQRVAAAEQLRQSEQRWRLLFDRSPVGIFHCDTDLVLTDCNERFVEILQSRRDRLLGLDLGTLDDPSVLPCIRDAAEGRNARYEGAYHATTSDASVWVSLETAPLTDAAGEVVGVVGIVADFSDRKSTEMRVEKLAEGLRRVVTIADELIACDDLDHMLRRAVELPRELLGIERCSVYLMQDAMVHGTFGTDLQGNTTDERGVVQEAWPTLPDVASADAKWDAPTVTLRDIRDGLLVDIGSGWVAHTPIRSATTPLGFFFNDAAITGAPVDPTLQDIVAVYCSLLGNILERKRAEQALRASERAGWVMLNATHDMAMLVSSDWRIEAINDSLAAALSLTADQLIGRAVQDVISPNLIAAAAHHAGRALRTGQPARFESSDDGLFYSTTLYPILGPSGEIERLAVFITDLSERRQAEESQRLAAVGQLAAGVAHEFNNILAIMSGRAQLAESYRRLEDFEELVNAVHRGTARGSEICRNLTSFARPVEPARSPVSIREPIDDALRMISREIANASVAVQVVDSAVDARIWADAGQLEQVFLNLFINAIHAMPAGGELTVSIRGDVGPAGQEQVVVTVADTGVGIPPEHQTRVFEPFFTTKGRLGESDVPGSGLGLSVSRGIVEAHGGSISLVSEENRGTTFELRFDQQHGEPAREAPAVLPELKTDDRTRRRLLLAEDESDLRELLTAFLRQRGFEVVVAADAAQALALLGEHAIDLVVTDYLMPGGGGGDVVRAACEAGVPAVVVSGRSDSESLEADIIALGAARLLTKPFALDDLISTVLSVLSPDRHNPSGQA